jgi:hypothetical protein
VKCLLENLFLDMLWRGKLTLLNVLFYFGLVFKIVPGSIQHSRLARRAKIVRMGNLVQVDCAAFTAHRIDFCYLHLVCSSIHLQLLLDEIAIYKLTLNIQRLNAQV